MRNLNLKLTGIVAAASLLLAPVANAQLSLSLDDGAGNTALVNDASNTGQIHYNNSLGTTWIVNVSSAFGAPLLGSDYMDEFDLLSANISGGVGTMTVMMTQTDLTRTDANWLTSVGGTTNGNISFMSYVDDDNTAFATTQLVTSDTVSGPAFSNVDSGGTDSFGLSDLFSWTVVATINHGSNLNVSSFDYNVKIPEPSSLALLGLGLIGAGFATRRKSKKTA